ncbi:MAG: protein-disulfide reductase DsbD domain-containing protein [Ferruginibacter sp.]
MKRIVFAFVLVLSFAAANAQQKISWSYAAKKFPGGNRYEIHITATPPIGWHIYSQFTPDGGPIPTTFKFNKNALVALQSKVAEGGKLVTYFDKNFKVDVKYFEGKVDFVTTVTLKGKIKTNLSGEVESMICNDRICMPPSTQTFNIALN